MEAPPILASVESELKKYILSPENLPIHQYEKNQKFWSREPIPKELLWFEESPSITTLQFTSCLMDISLHLIVLRSCHIVLQLPAICNRKCHYSHRNSIIMALEVPCRRLVKSCIN